MSKNVRTLMVIGRLREFDEEAWKRLLLAYAYYLHEQRTEHEAVNIEEPGGAASAGEPMDGGTA